MNRPGTAQNELPQQRYERLMTMSKDAHRHPKDQLFVAESMFTLSKEKNLEPQLRINLLEQAVRLDPFKRLYRLALGRAKHEWGLFEEAIDEYEWALTFWSESAEIYLLLGESRLEAGQYEEARKAFRQVLTKLEEAPAGDELAIRATYCLVECEVREANDEAGWKKVLTSLNNLTPAGWLDSGLFCEKCLKLIVECIEQPIREQALALAAQRVGQYQPSHPAYQMVQRIAGFDPQRSLAAGSPVSIESSQPGALEGLLTSYLLTRPLPNTGSDQETRLQHLVMLRELAENQADRWFGLREAYLYELGDWAAKAYRSKSFGVAGALWREAERIAPRNPAILQNLAILYTRLKDEGHYQLYWDRVTHTWVLYSELAQEAAGYERKLFQKHYAFMVGAKAQLEKGLKGPELLELGGVWIQEAMSYFGLRQLAFRNPHFRCGVRSDDWSGEQEREEALQVGYHSAAHWLRLLAERQGLNERSALAQWWQNQLAVALQKAKQDDDASYRFLDEEKETFGEYRDVLVQHYCLLLFAVLIPLAEALDLQDQTQSSAYVVFARHLLSFPHRLLKPGVLKLIEQLDADTSLERLVQNIAISPWFSKARDILKEQPAKAISYLQEVLKILPDFLPALFYLTMGYYLLEDWDATEATAKKTLRLCIGQDEETQAIKEQLEEILAQFPLVRVAKYINSARTAMDKKRWKDALPHLSQAQARLPNTVLILFYKAVCHFNLDEWDAAEQTAKQALPLCRTEDGDSQLAEQLRLILSQIPLARIAQDVKKARKAMDKERWSEALPYLDSALSKSPNEVVPLFYKALCHFRLRQWDTARQVAQRTLPLCDKDADYKSVKEQLQQLLAAVEVAPVTDAIHREDWSTGIREADNCLRRGTTDRALVLFYKAVCQFRSTMGDINGRYVSPRQSLFDPIEATLREADTACTDRELRQQINTLRSSVQRVRDQLRGMGIY